MDKENFIIGFGVVVILAIVIGIAFWLGAAKCSMSWPASLKPQYHMFVGCTVEANGLRVPEANYRVL